MEREREKGRIMEHEGKVWKPGRVLGGGYGVEAGTFFKGGGIM